MTAIEPARLQGEWRATRGMRLASLIPFGVPVVELLFARTYFGGPLSPPPDVMGIPLSLVFEVALLGWAALAAAVVWQTRSAALAAIALSFGTSFAIVGLIFRAAIILILQNMP